MSNTSAAGAPQSSNTLVDLVLRVLGDSPQAASTTGPEAAPLRGRSEDDFNSSPLGSGSASDQDMPFGLAQALLALISMLRQMRSDPSDQSDDAYGNQLQKLGEGLDRLYQTPPRTGANDSTLGQPKGPADAHGAGTTYDNNFAGNQRALRDALARQGATPEEAKMALGIQAVESNDGVSHDASKDGRTNGARNFSPLNLNEDMLRRNGVDGDYTQLNQPRTPADWDKVAKAYLTSKRNDSNFIHHLRNGYGDGRAQTADYEKGLAVQMETQAQHGLGTRANYDVAHK